jgi:hypothetical protein
MTRHPRVAISRYVWYFSVIVRYIHALCRIQSWVCMFNLPHVGRYVWGMVLQFILSKRRGYVPYHSMHTFGNWTCWMDIRKGYGCSGPIKTTALKDKSFPLQFNFSIRNLCHNFVVHIVHTQKKNMKYTRIDTYTCFYHNFGFQRCCVLQYNSGISTESLHLTPYYFQLYLFMSYSSSVSTCPLNLFI